METKQATVIKTNMEKVNNRAQLSIKDIDRIIEMAWEDRTTFEAIEMQFGLKEKEVIALMRKEMKDSSFKMWRKRTNGRTTKHAALRSEAVIRFKCKLQKTITHNKVRKR
jgi:uncharacterized protein (TIGR03643 family)